MKAVIYQKYGSPDVLRLEEVEKPIPGDNEVLVKVFAATVNRTDCANLTAKPFIMRFNHVILWSHMYNPAVVLPIFLLSYYHKSYSLHRTSEILHRILTNVRRQ